MIVAVFRHPAVSRWTQGLLVLIAACVVGCGDSKTGSLALTAEMPLHLEEHMDAASVERMREAMTRVAATPEVTRRYCMNAAGY